MEDSNSEVGVVLEKKIRFAESLVAIRKEGLYSLSEMAKIVDSSEWALQSWIYGRYAPSEGRQAQALIALENAKVTPSIRMRWQMESRHGLVWEASKRRWRLRFTVDTGRKTVGKRVCVSIKHRDPDVAIATRKAILEAFEQLGLKVKPRIQRRKAGA